MQGKVQAIVIGSIALMCITGLYMSMQNIDSDSIVAQYMQTTDGSYFKKYVKVNNEVERFAEIYEEAVNNAEQDEEQDTPPKDSEVVAWTKYIQDSDISDKRKTMLLEGFDCYNKGTIYHQLRSGAGTATQCLVECDSQTISDTYDFVTQANYNIDDPLYLDCSFFVKHCLWSCGLSTNSSSTGGMFDDNSYARISKEELIPGDVALKSGHTKIFVGYNIDSVPTWVEMSGHADDCKLSSHEISGEYVYLRHTELGG